MNHELEQGSRIVCDWSDMTNEFDVVPDNNTDDHETEGSEKKWVSQLYIPMLAYRSTVGCKFDT